RMVTDRNPGALGRRLRRRDRRSARPDLPDPPHLRDAHSPGMASLGARPMKGLAAVLGSLLTPLRRWNVTVVTWMLLGLIAVVAIYSTLFHQIMATEGQAFSWATSIYWTLTTMSTLGY